MYLYMENIKPGKLFFEYLYRKLTHAFVSKKKIQNYYESGKYELEVKKIIESAINKISQSSLPENAAVVFDVDETALCNYEYIKLQNFGYNRKKWHNYVKDAKGKVNSQVKVLYDWLVEKEVKIVFLTGRKADEYAATQHNLFEAGYEKYSVLICRSKEEEYIPATVFKIEKRKELEKNGLKIIATVGDQHNDVIGAATGLRIKIPNLLYFN